MGWKTCSQCRHWNEADSGVVGECRRRAPSTVGVCKTDEDSQYLWDWPMSGCEEWCGEWEGHDEPREVWNPSTRTLDTWSGTPRGKCNPGCNCNCNEGDNG